MINTKDLISQYIITKLFRYFILVIIYDFTLTLFQSPTTLRVLPKSLV